MIVDVLLAILGVLALGGIVWIYFFARVLLTWPRRKD